MKLSFDPAKPLATLTERGLDFLDAQQVFVGDRLEMVDDRFDCGEERLLTIGLLAGRMVVVIWTRRGDERRIISMRKANDREQALYTGKLGRS